MMATLLRTEGGIMINLAAFVGVLAVPATLWAQDQQLGARTKAMGGSYSASDDDPVALWHNPASIAGLLRGFALVYQTNVDYEIDIQNASSSQRGKAATKLSNGVIPSFIGGVFQLEPGMALGVCYARPYHVKYVTDRLGIDPVGPDSMVEHSFSRFRVALARDFQLAEAGKGGIFTHLAFGIAADLGYLESEYFIREVTAGPPMIVTIENVDDSEFMPLGGAVGILAGLVEYPGSFKLNLGAAYHSPIEFDANLNTDRYPKLDMPQQVNAGLAAYLLNDLLLRVTLDFQWIQWSDTAPAPTMAGHPGLRDAFNYSLGFEYRIKLSDTVSVYPRAGYRIFDAPWGDRNNLPMIGEHKLVLDTKASTFNIFTFGGGVRWTSEEGKARAIDLGIDVGGDSYNGAIGTSFEF